MTASHKHAGHGIEVVSTLPADRLASLCKEAADQSKLRLDAAQPGELTFSVRHPFFPEKYQFLVCVVRLSTDDDGRNVMEGQITQYQTRQKKMFGLIPTEPKKMMGLGAYANFLGRFGDLVQHADPEAEVDIFG